MWKPGTNVWILLLFLVPALGSAQTTPLTEYPGYFPIEELELFPADDLSVEINLTGAMLRMIGKATLSDDPDFSAIVSALEAIRVRIAPMDKLDHEKVRAGMARGAALLEERGWQPIVRIRDDDEQVFIYGRESAETMEGLTVFVLDSDEAVIVNLIGTIDFENLGSLVMGLDLPQVDRALRRQEGSSDREEDHR